MTTQYATSPDNIRIAYDVNSDGPTLMLLHGGGGSRQEWHAAGYVERLKDRFKVITVDLRGHGESDKPVDPADYTTAKMGDDILAVADARDADRFILWGYSFGGNVARYLAARSDRVSRLVLLGTHFGPGVSGEWRQMAVDFRARWAPAVHSQLGSSLKGSFDPQLLSQEDQEAIKQLSFPGALLPTVLAFSTAMLDWPTNSPVDILCPTLWLFGSENSMALDSFKEYEKSLPKSKVHAQILAGLDHPQEFDEIDQVLPVMLAFSQP